MLYCCVLDPAEDQRIAIFRSDAGRCGVGGGVLLRCGERYFRAAATAIVQQSAQQSFWRHEQNEPEREHYHADDEKQPSDRGDRGKSAGN